MFESRATRFPVLRAMAVALLCRSAQAQTHPESQARGSAAKPEPPTIQTHSQETGAPLAEAETETERTRTSFYGWQILAIGGAGGLLAAASSGLPDQPFSDTVSAFAFIVGAPAYGFGGPLVHWTHGHFEKGLLSLGGNIAFPLLGGVIGKSVACSHSPDCAGNGFGRGAAIGFLIAPILDALLLGWEQVPAGLVSQGSFSLRPYVDLPWGRPPAMGLVGQF